MKLLDLKTLFIFWLVCTTIKAGPILYPPCASICATSCLVSALFYGACIAACLAACITGCFS